MSIYEIQTTQNNTQEQSFTLFDMNLKLSLYFNKVSNSWEFDLFDIDHDKYIVQRKGLSVGSPSLIEKNLPFVVTLYPKNLKGDQPVDKVDLLNNFLILFVGINDYAGLIKTLDK